MKKNVLRVLSLILVASMLLVCASCSQTILVRFVDKDGNDLDLSGLGSAVVAGDSSSGSSSTDDTTPATDDTTPATDDTAPADDSSASAGSDASTPAAATTAPSGSSTASTSTVPSTKDEILNFYKAACNKITNDGAASYNKKEYQTISDLNITGSSAVDSAIANVVAGYMTTEDEAEVQACSGDDAKSRFPAFTLTDYSFIKTATLTKDGSNYKITIVTNSEDTPKKASSTLGKVTNSLLYWEDIEAELKNVSIVKSYDDVHVKYTTFTINAVITPEGHFVSMNQTANVDITIGSAKILIVSLSNKSAHLDNYATYSDFKY